MPSQWEGGLEDGRALYIRYRHGGLTVGAGPDVAAAVDSSAGRSPLHSAELGGSLDGYMTFSELKQALHGVLEFPDCLIVQDERTLAVSLPSDASTMGLASPDSSAG